MRQPWPTLVTSLRSRSPLAVVCSALIDLKTRRVPNPLTLGIAVLGVGLAVAGLSGLTLADALLGFVVGLVFMLPGFLIGATGGGDVKLFAALGTMLGPRDIGFAFLYALIAGGVLAVAVALRRRRFYETLGRDGRAGDDGRRQHGGDRARLSGQPVCVCAGHRGRNAW